MPEETIATAPLPAPAQARDYNAFLGAYLGKLRSEKPEFTAADLPTEAEARQYWGSGRTADEAASNLNAYSVRRTEGGLHYPDDKGVQVFLETPEGSSLTMGTVFYLPGQEKAALAEAKRRRIIE